MWFRLWFGFLFPTVVIPSVLALLIAPAGILVFIFVGLVVVGVPSLIYSLLMEFYVNRTIIKDSNAIVISSLLGFLSGAIPLLIVGIISPSYVEPIKNALIMALSLGVVGVMGGAIAGYVLIKHYKKQPIGAKNDSMKLI